MRRHRILGCSNSGGQALLIVLLAVSVILTAVLSVASRSIVDIKTTTYEEDALRAFSAAEAGVEQALLSGLGSTGTVTLDPATNTVFETTVTESPAAETFVYPHSLVSGETATFWFTKRDADGQFSCSDPGDCFNGNKIENICWGVNPSYASGKMPAIEVLAYYDETLLASSTNDYSNVKVARRAFDPDGSRANNFSSAATSPPCTIGDANFSFRTGQIMFNSGADGFPDMPGACSNTEGCVLAVKVRMLYNDDLAERVGIDVKPTAGTAGLAPQGVLIESTGVSGESTRKVNVFQSHSEVLPVFDTSVFSNQDLTKP